MSHFVVVVIGEKPEEQLEPFWELDLHHEDLQTDQRAVFEDCTDEVVSDWESEGEEVLILPDGSEMRDWGIKIKHIWDSLSTFTLTKLITDSAKDIIVELANLNKELEGGSDRERYIKDRIPELEKVLKSIENIIVPQVSSHEVLIDTVKTLHKDSPFGHGPNCKGFEKALEDFKASLKTRQRPYSEEYGNIQKFAKEYYGYHENDGAYGYYHNPDAKWDWFQVGGRWTGYFKLKPVILLQDKTSIMTEFGFGIGEFDSLVHLYQVNPVKFQTIVSKYNGKEKEITDAIERYLAPVLPEHKVGGSGVFGNKPKKGWADSCRMRDIDIEGMYEESMKEAAETYDKLEEVTEGLVLPPTWESVRESYSEEDIDKAREEYRNIPYNKAINKANLNPWDSEAAEYYFINDGGRERFIENAKCKSIVPFAVLMDGEWHEKGEMGWFGMTMNEKSVYDWVAKFTELWESLPEGTLVTAVDAHI